MENTGDRIKTLRGDTALAKFALKFDIHKSTLSRYEKGENQPDASFLRQLCSEFGVTPAWLLLGEGPMHESDRAPFYRGYPGKSKDEPSGYEDKAESGQMGLGQAVELLAKIFGSNNHILMRAIIANLQAFGEAIDNKNKEMQARAEMAQMQTRMDTMEKQMNALLEEINDMKAGQGYGCELKKEVVNGH
ncbi:helix-turn-helix domain-containing protein [bacterium]|nr:helix-turn-helix domain-containing protein [bacterium]